MTISFLSIWRRKLSNWTRWIYWGGS